jgi:ABC-type nitrate/sulfonate/bicarbonate transport system ATPase subunit
MRRRGGIWDCPSSIRLRGQSSHGSAKVLNDLSFAIDQNQVIGVLDGSGCGKSTLLRLICGILPNSARNMVAGKIEYDGRTRLQDLRSTGRICLMFREPSLLPNLTVEENIDSSTHSQPARTDILYDFRELWQSPRFWKSLISLVR